MNERPFNEVPMQESNPVTSDVQLNRAERRASKKNERKANKAKGLKVEKLNTRSKQIRAHITNRNAVNFHQKNNKAWDDIVLTSQNAWTLLSLTVSLTPVLRRTELTNYYPDINYIGRLARTLVAEVTMLLHEFSKIKKSHENRSGRAKDIDELLYAYEIFNNYAIIMEKYNSCAAHLFDAVSEQIGIAIEAYRVEAGDEASNKLANELRESVKEAVSGLGKAKANVEKQMTEEPVEQTNE